MKVYFDNDRLNIVVEGIGRLMANGSVIAIADGDNVSLSYKDTDGLLTYLHFEAYQKENGDAYGIDSNSVAEALNLELSKSMTGDDISEMLGYEPYNGESNPNGYMTEFSETDPHFDTKFSGKTTTDLTEGSNLYHTDSRSRASISMTNTGSGNPSYDYTSGTIFVPKADYSNTTTTTSGNAVFYLTTTGLLSGEALYTNVTHVTPVINDSAYNYTYGWTLSADKKTLTVTAKVSSQTAVALIGLTVLGVPTNVTNGTSVSVLVKGN